MAGFRLKMATQCGEKIAEEFGFTQHAPVSVGNPRCADVFDQSSDAGLITALGYQSLQQRIRQTGKSVASYLSTLSSALHAHG
ncbi:hypothetical protein [Mesorhizobium sp. YR577]|uniref:hypothetical protein n=1 Tax=Mesorhizobium sp. YR577 TaxID=1884373 RepID=UPI0008E0A6F8|nr:hypothetical protein [Mesorhizobium sp. YR577]SFU21249.1 hypothetical protein SAMN05518861_12653 [Mesorhizobium sp. YR577]